MITDCEAWNRERPLLKDDPSNEDLAKFRTAMRAHIAACKRCYQNEANLEAFLKSIESQKKEVPMNERQVLAVVLDENLSPDEIIKRMEAIRMISGVVSVKTMDRVLADGLPEAAAGN